MSVFKDIKRLGFFSTLKLAFSSFDIGLIKLKITGGHNIFIRSAKSSDAAVLRQVFSGGEYNTKNKAFARAIEKHYLNTLENGKTPVFIDLGANNGLSSVFFAQKFPKARILSVEPDNSNFEMIKLNCKSFENIIPYNAAIGGSAGFVSVNNDCAEWAVTTERAETGLKIITINELLELNSDCQLFGVKIDIEGFEDDLFSANLEWLESVKIMYIEPHDWMLPSKGTSLNFQKIMANKNMEFLLSGENIIYCDMK